MRERALGVQERLTSVANEVVVLVMVGGAGSTAARGLRQPTGSSLWPRTTSTDPRQPSLGWPDVHLHASNRVLVTVVTQRAVGLEKSKAAAGREWRRWAGRLAAVVGRMRALWICLARSRIWTAHVTVFNETTSVPLMALCSNWNFMGTIVNIGGKFWAARTRFACYRWRVGQCHGRRWLVNLDRLCWDLGQRLSFLYWLLTLTRGPVTIFFEWNFLPWFIRAHKKHLKIIKIRTIHIWTFSIWIKYQQSHLCAQDY
jgi:hypothetical protein